MLNQRKRKHTNYRVRQALNKNGYSKIRMRTYNKASKKFILGDILFDGIALLGNKKIYFTKNLDTIASENILKKYKNIVSGYDRRICLWINIVKWEGVQINNKWALTTQRSHPGYKHTEASKKKMSIARSGKKNWKWQKNPTYNAVHTWVRKHKPKVDKCEHCGEYKELEAANISGEYKRDINDFEWLCSLCHMKKDGRYSNIKEYGNMAGPINKDGKRTRLNDTPILKSISRVVSEDIKAFTPKENNGN